MPPKASDGVAYGSGLIDDFGRCTETNATQPKASSEEPFRSFRMLDAKLTLLANQQDALKAAFNPVQSGSGSEAANSGRRTAASRSMNFTAAGIVRDSGRVGAFVRKAPSALRGPNV